MTDEEINDLIDLWHEGAGWGMSLSQWLGWSELDYALWVEGKIPAPPISNTMKPLRKPGFNSEET